MILSRKGMEAVNKKNISISLDSKVHNIILQSFDSFYRKDNSPNYAVFIEVVKTNSQFKRVVSDEVLIKVEIDKTTDASGKITNKIIKLIERVLQSNMSESLEDKIVILKKELNQIKKEFDIKMNVSLNAGYLPKPAEKKNNNNNNNNNVYKSLNTEK